MKKLLKIGILTFLLLILNINKNYAATSITKENLIDSFNQLFSLENFKETNEIFTENLNKFPSLKDELEKNPIEDIKCSISDTHITITLNEDKDYLLKYDLTNKPTFSYEIPIKKGMSYDEYTEQIGNMFFPLFGYTAFADVQGVNVTDALSYVIISFSEELYKNITSTEDDLVIYNDLDLDNNSQKEDTNNPNVIYASEFGNRCIEFVNSLFPTKQILSDKNELNSYTMTIERQNITETSCNLVFTLVVNTDANFSKLNGFVDRLENIIDITPDTADYVINLKVGQKCKLKANTVKQIRYEYYGEYTSFNEKTAEITALKPGISYGYFYINDKKSSVYIKVDENTSNETLNTITLELDSKNTASNSNINNNTNNNTNANNNNSNNSSNSNANKLQQNVDKVTSSTSKLPQTGRFFNLKDGLTLVSIFAFLILITIIIKDIKYKNITKK